MGRHLGIDFHHYDVLPRPVGPYKWHSQFFELFFVSVYLRCTPNNIYIYIYIYSQAQVEHHSFTGDWERQKCHFN